MFAQQFFQLSPFLKIPLYATIGIMVNLIVMIVENGNWKKMLNTTLKFGKTLLIINMKTNYKLLSKKYLKALLSANNLIRLYKEKEELEILQKIGLKQQKYERKRNN
jgi:ABC-type lipoprotein release transport system permease subunit